MAVAMAGLAGLFGLGSLICWIMVLIRLFPEEGMGKGIFGVICGIYAFIWGWQNANRLQIRTVMMVWTVCFIGGTLFNIAARAMA